MIVDPCYYYSLPSPRITSNKHFEGNGDVSTGVDWVGHQHICHECDRVLRIEHFLFLILTLLFWPYWCPSLSQPPNRTPAPSQSETLLYLSDERGSTTGTAVRTQRRDGREDHYTTSFALNAIIFFLVGMEQSECERYP